MNTHPVTFMVSQPADFQSVIQYVSAQFENLPQPTIITLTGDLGAGKTTFTQELGKTLGITAPVVSPTFGIMKVYEIMDHLLFDQLVHIDAYRIEDSSEAGPLRLAELFTTARTLLCIEWPEQIAQLIPAEHIAITLKITHGEQREVTVR